MALSYWLHDGHENSCFFNLKRKGRDQTERALYGISVEAAIREMEHRKGRQSVQGATAAANQG